MVAGEHGTSDPRSQGTDPVPPGPDLVHGGRQAGGNSGEHAGELGGGPFSDDPLPKSYARPGGWARHTLWSGFARLPRAEPREVAADAYCLVRWRGHGGGSFVDACLFMWCSKLLWSSTRRRWWWYVRTWHCGATTSRAPRLAPTRWPPRRQRRCGHGWPRP